ncbi:hypothetical protein ACSTD8_01705 [Vibrio vulnificus]|uniref:hypothetical protein n=1 Tax=Vibrio vulnificus TaxID=672 RepID=UPI0021D960FF|nr:hypothetical protein [Vibrio vulnificus]
MEKIIIDVGGLRSVSSVYFSTRKSLDNFNLAWRSGHQPSVVWDLRQIKAGKINVAAVAFLLALAHRVRQFTGRKQNVVIEWHPNLFTFLSDINFFSVSDSYDLFHWPFEIGGFESGKTNPNTKIISYDQLENVPTMDDIDGISHWKRIHRENYRSDIINSCEALFSVNDVNSPTKLPLIMSRTCAELVTNSLLWGDATPFIGLQRTKNRIFISVSDVGKGLRQSLSQKKVLDKAGNFDPNLASIALACIMNQNDFGLKRAISTVTELGGNISISSGNSEISWGRELWASYLHIVDSSGIIPALSLIKNSEIMEGSVSLEQREYGYFRLWPTSIRGTRVSFSIPIERY